MNPCYIVRRGTNVRALQFDQSPVIVTTEEAAEAALEFYDSRVPMRDLGPLDAVPMAEYHLTWRRAEANAKAEARAQMGGVFIAGTEQEGPHYGRP